jgi:hypothetical protein
MVKDLILNVIDMFLAGNIEKRNKFFPKDMLKIMT